MARMHWNDIMESFIKGYASVFLKTLSCKNFSITPHVWDLFYTETILLVINPDR